MCFRIELYGDKFSKTTDTLKINLAVIVSLFVVCVHICS